MELSQELALSLINSSKQFPIDFEQALKWSGCKDKETAKKRLVRNFERGSDYDVFHDRVLNSTEQSSLEPTEAIALTIECFKGFALMAGTAKGKEVRKYFLECEKIAKKALEAVPRQSERIKELELRIELATINNQWLERISLLGRNYGVPTAMALLGRENAVVQVEKATVEIIDKRHNRELKFSGQTLKQVRDYISEKYGIYLKDETEIRQKLKALKRDDLIAQTLRSSVSDYIPKENLEEVYKLLTGGNKQTLLGE